MRRLAWLSLLALLQTSTFTLRAQAPPATRTSAPDLPRFTLRQIVAGTSDTLTRIPGRWWRAALAAVPDSLPMRRYREAASRSGLVPLSGSVLQSERSAHVMGLYRRRELTAAIRRTLEAIRQTIPEDSTRGRFDHLFRQSGEWTVDLHDVALSWARRRAPGIGWSSARRALAAARWIPAGDAAASDAAVARALYGLAVLGASDSAALGSIRSDLLEADSVSGRAALLLLAGYIEGQRWYVDVLDFFLRQPWIAEGRRGSSLGDRVEAYWRRMPGPATMDLAVPEIRTRFFGYPQAVPHYGVPERLFERLVRADNAGARAWLAEHGRTGLLRAVRFLPPGDSTLTLVEQGSYLVRLTSVSRQARESLNGFLEPRDAIAIDPGYSPLLALGAVLHEWQHLLFRQRQLEAYASRLPRRHSRIVDLPWVEPTLAEGFAEWSTEQILGPLVRRWPLLGVGELQKRAGLGPAGAGDQHTVGYALARALAAVLPSPEATTELLLEHAERPSSIVETAAVRRAWDRYAGAPDRLVGVAAPRILIPEVTFTIEDGFPDVIASRILVARPEGGR